MAYSVDTTTSVRKLATISLKIKTIAMFCYQQTSAWRVNCKPTAMDPVVGSR